MEREAELNAVAAELERALGDTKAFGAEAVDLCKIYRDARPWIDKLATILESLPIPPWAKTAGKVLRLLMSIADQFCPA